MALMSSLQMTIRVQSLASPEILASSWTRLNSSLKNFGVIKRISLVRILESLPYISYLAILNLLHDIQPNDTQLTTTFSLMTSA